MSQEQVKKLSDDELRIKVAELCGWKYMPCPCGACEPYRKVWCLNNKAPYFDLLSSLPDYTKDLNAMHEAEKLLDDRKLLIYGTVLECELGTRWGHATARQRAEAFVRAMGRGK